MCSLDDWGFCSSSDTALAYRGLMLHRCKQSSLYYPGQRRNVGLHPHLSFPSKYGPGTIGAYGGGHQFMEPGSEQ